MSFVTPYPDLAVPDAIFGPDGLEHNDDPLDPCPFCNSSPSDAPEGVHSVHSAKKNGAVVGSAVWNHPHCWKCGYRPGVNLAASEASMRRAFDRFKAYVNEQVQASAGAPGMAPPANPGEVETLRAQLAASQAAEAALREQLSPPE